MTDPERDNNLSDDEHVASEAEFADRLGAILENLKTIDALSDGALRTVETVEVGARRDRGFELNPTASEPVAPVLTAKRTLDGEAREAEADFYDLLKWRVAQQSRLTRRQAEREAKAEDLPLSVETEPKAEPLEFHDDEDDWERDWVEDEWVDPDEWQGPVWSKIRVSPSALALGLLVVVGGTGVGLIGLNGGNQTNPDTELALSEAEAGGSPLLAHAPPNGSAPEMTTGPLLPEAVSIKPESPVVTAELSPQPSMSQVDEAWSAIPLAEAKETPARPIAAAPEPTAADGQSVQEPRLPEEPIVLAARPESAPVMQLPTPQPADEPAIVSGAEAGSAAEMAAADHPKIETEALGYAETAEPRFPDFSPSEEAAPPTTAPRPTDRAAAPAIGTGTATATAYVNMRAGPNNEAATITIIPAGATVLVANCEAWCAVRYQGKDGYVYPKFLDQR